MLSLSYLLLQYSIIFNVCQHFQYPMPDASNSLVLTVVCALIARLEVLDIFNLMYMPRGIKITLHVWLPTCPFLGVPTCAAMSHRRLLDEPFWLLSPTRWLCRTEVERTRIGSKKTRCLDDRHLFTPFSPCIFLAAAFLYSEREMRRSPSLWSGGLLLLLLQLPSIAGKHYACETDITSTCTYLVQLQQLPVVALLR